MRMDSEWFYARSPAVAAADQVAAILARVERGGVAFEAVLCGVVTTYAARPCLHADGYMLERYDRGAVFDTLGDLAAVVGAALAGADPFAEPRPVPTDRDRIRAIGRHLDALLGDDRNRRVESREREEYERLRAKYETEVGNERGPG